MRVCCVRHVGGQIKNKVIRDNITEQLNSDIFCLVGIHLRPEYNEETDNYTSIKFTKAVTHVKASGSIGLLIKNSLLREYNKHILDKNVDAILSE